MRPLPDRGIGVLEPLDHVRRVARPLPAVSGHFDRQRDLIVDTFFTQTGHLSVDELLDKVTARDSSIGAATVYRTMKILTDAGLASARHFEGGQTRYEAALDRHHHDHLICTSCGRIFEFENERIEELQARVAEQHGFRVTHHKLELYGLCKACQERQQ